MKRRVIVLTMLFALILSLPAFAAEPRVVIVRPTLNFTETTANCQVVILGNSNDDDIVAVIKFWENGRCIETWNEEATGILNFNTTMNAVKRNTYKLTVDAVIDGDDQPTAYIEKTHN